MWTHSGGGVHGRPSCCSCMMRSASMINAANFLHSSSFICQMWLNFFESDPIKTLCKQRDSVLYVLHFTSVLLLNIVKHGTVCPTRNDCHHWNNSRNSWHLIYLNFICASGQFLIVKRSRSSWCCYISCLNYITLLLCNQSPRDPDYVSLVTLPWVGKMSTSRAC